MVRAAQCPLARLSIPALALMAFPSAALAQQAPQVVPGLEVRYTARPGTDTVVFQRSITRAGQDTSAGTRTVVFQVTHGEDHQQLLEVEQRFPAGGGEIVDTAIADLATLRAVAHRSHQPSRTMRFDFTAKTAEGTVVSIPGDSVTSVHQDLGGLIFDSNVIDLVVASLPLKQGFTADVPFFIYERGGRVPMTVAVKARARIAFAKLGQREVWVVSVSVPDAPATVWVDTKTHAVLRIRYDIAARSMSFTDERVTPLRS